ncbi:hypothetical protein EBR56_09715, partial [bacterium]|nr:hypothetical protein [bacterium]
MRRPPSGASRRPGRFSRSWRRSCPGFEFNTASFPDGVHPASWYQSANPTFVVLFAPVFAWVWVALGKRNLDPSSPAKFGLALLLLGIGFLTMMLASQ